MAFFLFAGIRDCHDGGMYDYRGGFDSADQAKAAINSTAYIDWAHIATLTNSTWSDPYGLEIVWTYDKDTGWIAAENINSRDQ